MEITAHFIMALSSGKDWWDKTSVIVNVVLAVGGLCTLIFVCLQWRVMAGQRKTMQDTLGEIKRQADEMVEQRKLAETQTGILRDSVAAAQKSADAAKASADVARGVSVPTLLIHELESYSGGLNSPELFFKYPAVKIILKNYGQTPAILKWWTCSFTCENLPDIPVYDAQGLVLEKVIVLPGETYTLPGVPFHSRQDFSVEDAKAVVSREKPFRVYGYICYGDIFGNPLRRLKYCETVLNIFGGEAICDWWEGFAPSAYEGVDEYPRSSGANEE